MYQFIEYLSIKSQTRPRLVFAVVFAGFACFGWLSALGLTSAWERWAARSSPLLQESAPQSRVAGRFRSSQASAGRIPASVTNLNLAPITLGRTAVTSKLEAGYWQVLKRWSTEGVDSKTLTQVELQCRGNFQTPQCDRARELLVIELRRNLKGARASLFECELADVYFRAGSKVISCATAVPGNEAELPQGVVDILDRSCRGGDGKSCFSVGHRQFRLFNDLQARHYFDSGCALGEVKACFALGELFRWQGKLDLALPLMRKACGKGDRWQAMACFGQASIEIELFNNRRAAEQALRASCSLGEPAGCYQLANLLMEDPSRRDQEVHRILARGCFQQQGVFGFNPLPCWSLIEFRKAFYGGSGINEVVDFMHASRLYEPADQVTVKNAHGDLALAKLVSMMSQDMRGMRLYSCGRAYQTLMAFGAGPQEFGLAADACRSLVESERLLRYDRRDQGIFRNYARFQ